MVCHQTSRRLHSQNVKRLHLMLVAGLAYSTVSLILMIYNSSHGSLQTEQVNMKTKQNIVKWYEHERHEKDSQLENMISHGREDVADGIYIEKYAEGEDHEHMANLRLGLGFGADAGVEMERELTWDADTAADVYLKMYGSYCENHFTTGSHGSSLEMCPCVPHNLEGKVAPDMGATTLTDVIQMHDDVTPGGHWSPQDCVPRQKIALIIPFRDRSAQLPVFLRHIISIFKRQMLEFRIIVAEQRMPPIFNKATMMNIGFSEAERLGVDCVIFHDIDLLTEDDRNFYTCFKESPRHVAVYVEKLSYILKYAELFGAATAFTVDQFRQINGFPNTYYGWGGEDDDMFRRIHAGGYGISRSPKSVNRYRNIPHEKDRMNPVNDFRERGAEYRPAEYALDGLNSLRYRVVERGEQALYTHLLIDLGYPKIFACSNMPANPFDTQKGEIFKSTVEDYRKQIERDRARY